MDLRGDRVQVMDFWDNRVLRMIVYEARMWYSAMIWGLALFNAVNY